MAVNISPLIANSGAMYVRIEAVGMLAVFRGTCELLFSAVGRAKNANPALPIEIRMSARLSASAS